MAKYTVQIRQLVESGYPLFDFDYPIFDEAYRPVLEQKITDYYYFREIGLETPAQFKQFLKAKMNLIMPYYNDMYNAKTDFGTMKWFFNKNLTDTFSKTSESDSTSNNTSTDNGDTTDTTKVYDTPQSQLSGVDNYLTEETSTEHTGSTTQTESGTGKITTTEQYTMTSVGDDGMRYPASVYQEINEALINIDMKIIDDLRGLFMNVY